MSFQNHVGTGLINKICFGFLNRLLGIAIVVGVVAETFFYCNFHIVAATASKFLTIHQYGSKFLLCLAPNLKISLQKCSATTQNVTIFYRFYNYWQNKREIKKRKPAGEGQRKAGSEIAMIGDSDAGDGGDTT